MGRAAAGAKSGRPRRSAGAAVPHQTNLMKYAADNRVVQAVYTFTTAYKPLFILLVVAAVAVGVYFPVRDLYVAQRTQNILEQQVAIRKKYNDSLGKEVDQYLSKEGIEDAARKNLGMVMPGEKTITVEGLDEDGNPIVKQQEGTEAADGAGGGEGSDSANKNDDSNANVDPGANVQDGQASDGVSNAGDTGEDVKDPDGKKEDSGKLKGADAADKSKTGSGADAEVDPDKNPTTSAEAETAEHAVLENSPWYWKLLDAIFFFDGANGMAVVSTGDQATNGQNE